MTPQRIGAIVTAYTGFLIGSFEEFHKYVEEIMERSVWSHEFADSKIWEEIKQKSKPDLLLVDKWCKNEP